MRNVLDQLRLCHSWIPCMAMSLPLLCMCTLHMCGHLCLLLVSMMYKFDKDECNVHWTLKAPENRMMREAAQSQTHQAEMDVPSELHAILEVTSHSPNHAQQQCLFHIFMSKDLWSKTGCQNAIDVFPLR